MGSLLFSMIKWISGVVVSPVGFVDLIADVSGVVQGLAVPQAQIAAAYLDTGAVQNIVHRHVPVHHLQPALYHPRGDGDAGPGPTQPLPVQRSSSRHLSIRPANSTAASASTSVSARGISTAGVTSSVGPGGLPPERPAVRTGGPGKGGCSGRPGPASGVHRE